MKKVTLLVTSHVDVIVRYVLDGPYMSKLLGGCLDEDVW